MVNKCSVMGCKSLYSKDIVKIKLHRFPLTNLETLPQWIAVTGRQSGWKPCKSSRLCSNHFQPTEYIVGHGKGVLKPSAVPTIDYRVHSPRYNRNKYENYKHVNLKQMNKLIKVEPMAPECDTNVEIVQVDFEEIYDSKYEMTSENSNQNKEMDISAYNNNDEQLFTNELERTQNEEETYSNFTIKSEVEEDYGETSKNEYYECDNINNKSDIYNRDNQCYMFTSSFKEGVQPINLPLQDNNEEPPLPAADVNPSSAEISFNKIMSLKLLKKHRRTKDIYAMYFKSMIKSNLLKRENNEKKLQSINDDTASFGNFIEVQMKELRPYKRLYLSTKHKIQKVLMKAQLKIAA